MINHQVGKRAGGQGVGPPPFPVACGVEDREGWPRGCAVARSCDSAPWDTAGSFPLFSLGVGSSATRCQGAEELGGQGRETFTVQDGRAQDAHKQRAEVTRLLGRPGLHSS
jgi:hypothetical protein